MHPGASATYVRGARTGLLRAVRTKGVPCTAYRGTTGVKAVNKDAVQMKVTIVPDKSPSAGDQWALIVSISHTIADGYTYYEVRAPSLTSPRLASP